MTTEYQFSDGRITTKHDKMYKDHIECIADMPNMSDDHVEYYAHYFGWYTDGKHYGNLEGEPNRQEIARMTHALADAARAEFAKRHDWKAGHKPVK